MSVLPRVYLKNSILNNKIVIWPSSLQFEISVESFMWLSFFKQKDLFQLEAEVENL